MNDLQDARIAKLPKWARREFETQSRRIRHLESAIANYEGEGESRVSYNYGSNAIKEDHYLPKNVHIEWKLKSGTLIRIHERMEGHLAISTDGQLSILPHAANWIEIP